MARWIPSSAPPSRWVGPKNIRRLLNLAPVHGRPSLSAQNLQCIKIGKDFMVSHGYIKNDFDVDKWAAPEFLEQATTEVLKEEWQRRSWSKLPEGGKLDANGTRLG